MTSLPKQTSVLAVFIAWMLVAIPLGWGLYQSVTKSRPLFTINQPASPEKPANPSAK